MARRASIEGAGAPSDEDLTSLVGGAKIVSEKIALRRLASLTELGPGVTNVAIHSVVKIYNFYTPPNISMPWQMHRQLIATSSGFVISDRRILCNAHGVRHHSTVRIRKPGDPTKFLATVLAVGHECDLALLTVESDEFWADLVALPFGDVPRLQAEVVVIGYPTGGDNISVTKGIVSRVDVTRYAHVGESLLGIQIDAPINPGNSGGPTLVGNKVVGVAFEAIVDLENVGYIIPVPIIEHFLEDLEKHKKYTGFCMPSFFWQDLQNTCMRESLKMKKEQHCILVSTVFELQQSFNVLKKRDVILSIDGVPIGDDGTIEYRPGERVSFSYLFSMKFSDETTKVTFLRDGKIVESVLNMEKRIDLVALHLYDTKPQYYVFAGLVFVPLSRPWLVSEYGEDWPVKAPIGMCHMALNQYPKKADQQLVILSQVIVTELNFGYQDLVNFRVRAVNGVEINNISHLIEVVEESKEEFLTFDIGKFTTIVLDRAKGVAGTQAILESNHIRKNKCVPEPEESSS
eukprot:159332_1